MVEAPSLGLTNYVVDSRVLKNALGSGGLSPIDVGHDADVADLVQDGEHNLCQKILRLSRELKTLRGSRECVAVTSG
jgi:hypothetical protein